MEESMKKILKKLKLSALYFLFIILIGLTITVYSLSNFSEEDNMKEYFKDVLLKDSNIHEIGNKTYDIHKENCLKGATEQILPSNDGNKTISCKVILSATEETYGDKIIENVLFKDVYEKTYSCTFIQCMMNKDTIPVIFSRQGHFYLNNIRTFLILGTVICGLLLLISFDEIRIAIKTFGSVFLIIGSSYFVTGLTKFNEEVVSKTAIALTNPINPTLLTLFIVGLVMVLFSFFISKEETWGTLLERITGRY